MQKAINELIVYGRGGFRTGCCTQRPVVYGKLNVRLTVEKDEVTDHFEHPSDAFAFVECIMQNYPYGRYRIESRHNFRDKKGRQVLEQRIIQDWYRTKVELKIDVYNA